MKIKINAYLLGILLGAPCFLKAQDTAKIYHEQYRPQIHFSPQRHWTNDPNGMVFYKDTYHLFFQYYPNGTTWGPMHWGHAITKDLIHWKELPIELYPDSLGYIFSGSAVVDSNNTSGFGKNGSIPLVAIFTNHDPVGEKEGKNDFQNQSLAFSLDDGFTWTKYSENPVLRNPGIRDFRDPKVMWYAKEKKWVMTLATKNRITFYSSPDLKSWEKESEFGEKSGAHGGVWECPDLFPLKLRGKTYWVLIVNLNPGGPNGGSATQYFIGQFDGNKFISNDDKIRWIDYGPDEYAGITWSNTGNRRIFLGWMSNWQYANQVPTMKWRNAMTLPRDLKLAKIGNEFFLKSMPVRELQKLKTVYISQKHIIISKPLTFKAIPQQFAFSFETDTNHDYEVSFSNSLGDKLRIGYNKSTNHYFIDRTQSGLINFNPEFGKSIHYSPRLGKSAHAKMLVIVDKSSIELFADDGLTVMTAVYFSKSPFNQLTITSKKGDAFNNVQIDSLRSIWKETSN